MTDYDRQIRKLLEFIQKTGSINEKTIKQLRFSKESNERFRELYDELFILKLRDNWNDLKDDNLKDYKAGDIIILGDVDDIHDEIEHDIMRTVTNSDE